MNDQTSAPDQAPPEPATRAERAATTVAEYRAEILSRTTSTLLWVAIGVGVVSLALILFGVIANMTVLLVSELILFAVAGWRVRELARKDRALRALALLTPVLDRATLSAQCNVLRAAGLALASATNPGVPRNIRGNVCAGVRAAAAPLLARGGLDERTATSPGYPAWPAVDRSEMPGTDDDFLSLPLAAVDSFIAAVCEEAEADRTVHEETIAALAGRIVPPLRSVETELGVARPVPEPELVR